MTCDCQISHFVDQLQLDVTKTRQRRAAAAKKAAREARKQAKEAAANAAAGTGANGSASPKKKKKKSKKSKSRRRSSKAAGDMKGPGAANGEVTPGSPAMVDKAAASDATVPAPADGDDVVAEESRDQVASLELKKKARRRRGTLMRVAGMAIGMHRRASRRQVRIFAATRERQSSLYNTCCSQSKLMQHMASLEHGLTGDGAIHSHHAGSAADALVEAPTASTLGHGHRKSLRRPSMLLAEA